MKKRILLISLLLLIFVLKSKADQLQLITLEQAKTTYKYLKDNNIKEVMLWCACCENSSKQKLSISDFYYEKSKDSNGLYYFKIEGITVDGEKISEAVDLAYVHIPINNKAECLGKVLGFECDPCTLPFAWKGGFDTKELENIAQRYSGVTAVVENGVITLNGKIERENLIKVMQEVSSLNPVQVINKLEILDNEPRIGDTKHFIKRFDRYLCCLDIPTLVFRDDNWNEEYYLSWRGENIKDLIELEEYASTSRNGCCDCNDENTNNCTFKGQVYLITETYKLTDEWDWNGEAMMKTGKKEKNWVVTDFVKFKPVNLLLNGVVEDVTDCQGTSMGSCLMRLKATDGKNYNIRYGYVRYEPNFHQKIEEITVLKGKPQAGSKVRVLGTTTPDGTILAARIDIQ